MTDLNYEKKDISLRVVWFLAGSVLLVTAISMFFMDVIQDKSEGWFAKKDGPASVFSGKRSKPLGPELEANPGEELLKVNQVAEQRLNQYQILDRQNGVIQVPIARAIELILIEDLPARNRNFKDFQ